MTGSGGHALERWRSIDAVVAAYAGTPSGHDAFARALHTLRSALPTARISLLRPAAARPRDARDIERMIEYVSPSSDRATDGAARDATRRAVEALSACGAEAALVFAEKGTAPYTPAYLCYLAGIGYRAGFEAEFGGAVLSPSLPLPRELDDGERHLALLAAVGLEQRSPRIPAPATVPSTNWSPACDR